MSEREVKLSPPPGYQLPVLDDPANGIFAVTDEPVALHAVYWDTPDLRLSHAGASLRHRNGKWTVKLPHGGAGDVLVRDEHDFTGPADEPPAAAVDLVRAYVRSAPLEVVVRMRTLRRRIVLRDRQGLRLGEVADDEVSVLEGRRVESRFREVEVEVTEDGPDAWLADVVTRLRAAGAGAPDPTPKVVRALGLDLSEDDTAAAPALNAQAPAGAVVQRAIASSVARLFANDAGVRLGTDPESVHQARVATRRLRSDLRTFAPLLDEAWAEHLRDELRTLAAALGEVRDDDVLLERLQTKIARLPRDDQAGAQPLVDRLVGERELARKRLLELLRAPGYSSLLDHLVVASRAPMLTDAADVPASVALPPLVRRPWHKLRQAVHELDDDPEDQALHDVRIRVKRARYAAEAVVPALGKEPRRFAKALAEVGEVLGDHQDAVVAMSWLRSARIDAGGGASPSVAAAWSAGVLAGMEHEDALAHREKWYEAWKAASSARLREWLTQPSPARSSTP